MFEKFGRRQTVRGLCGRKDYWWSSEHPEKANGRRERGGGGFEGVEGMMPRISTSTCRSFRSTVAAKTEKGMQAPARRRVCCCEPKTFSFEVQLIDWVPGLVLSTVSSW